MKINVWYNRLGPGEKVMTVDISDRGTRVYDVDRILGYLKKATRVRIDGNHLHCADILNRQLMSPGNKITHIIFEDSKNEWLSRFDPTYLEKLVEGLTHPNNKVDFIDFLYKWTRSPEDDKRMRNIIETLLSNVHFHARLEGKTLSRSEFFGLSRLCAIREKNNKLHATTLFGLCWTHLLKSGNDCSSLPPLIVKEGIQKYGVWAEDIFDSRQKIFEIQKMGVMNDAHLLLLRERLKDYARPYY